MEIITLICVAILPFVFAKLMDSVINMKDEKKSSPVLWCFIMGALSILALVFWN